MSIFWAILLFVLMLLFWGLTLVGMPGNWLMVAAAGLYLFLGPTDERLAIGGYVFVLLVGLALLGEGLELLASALGVARAGGSRRGAVLALLGAMMGGILGLFVGAPAPVIGSMLAAVLLASLGALAGAMMGEIWKGRPLGDSWTIGKAAFWGRLFGTLAKTTIGAVMVAVVAAALVFE